MTIAFSTLFSWLLKKRVHQIELFMKFPCDVQREVLNGLLDRAQDTEFGKKYNFSQIRAEKDDYTEEGVVWARYKGEDFDE